VAPPLKFNSSAQFRNWDGGFFTELFVSFGYPSTDVRFPVLVQEPSQLLQIR